MPVVQSQLYASSRTGGGFKLSDFVIQRTLGTGSFGRVHLGKRPFGLSLHWADEYPVWSQHKRRFYAIKVLSKEKVVRTKQVEHTKNEKHLLSNVHNPFIVNVWGAFQDSTNLYMVMDFVAGGELFTLLRRAKVRFLSCLTSERSHWPG